MVPSVLLKNKLIIKRKIDMINNTVIRTACLERGENISVSASRNRPIRRPAKKTPVNRCIASPLSEFSVSLYNMQVERQETF